jgi:fumarate hydratase class II
MWLNGEPAMTPFRTERDSMGEVRLPAHAYYGPQTQRAVENFPISGRPLPPELIHALGLVKWAAAAVNRDLGRLSLPETLLSALLAACREVADGKLDDQFPVDVFQTGSGTSSNMNANEVIANRAMELAGAWEKGDAFVVPPLGKAFVVPPSGGKGRLKPELQTATIHANDHVNLGQSTNDVFPTAIHVAAAVAIHDRLIPALARCGEVLAAKAAEWKDILKIGRTHLTDATPLSLGQEIGGLAHQLERSSDRAVLAIEALLALPIGGTAVGTGINTHAEFGRRVCEALAKETGMPFVEAADHFEANAQRDGLVECHGQLRTIATTLFNVANNIRWLASGPRCGFHEIRLPDLQPGSSIMPGKVNPVLCESLMQAAARVLGNDQTIVVCGARERAAAGQRGRRLCGEVPGRHGSRRGSVRGVGGKEPCNGNGLKPVARLRACGGTGEGGVGHGQDNPRTVHREERASRGAAQRGARSVADDPAAAVNRSCNRSQGAKPRIWHTPCADRLLERPANNGTRRVPDTIRDVNGYEKTRPVTMPGGAFYSLFMSIICPSARLPRHQWIVGSIV